MGRSGRLSARPGGGGESFLLLHLRLELEREVGGQVMMDVVWGKLYGVFGLG